MHPASVALVAAAPWVCACGDIVNATPGHDSGADVLAASDATSDTALDTASADARIADSSQTDASICTFAPDAACNTLALCGPQIVPTCLPDPPPQPQGGSIVLGTYALTAITFYACNSPVSGTLRDVLKVGPHIAGTDSFVLQELGEAPPAQPYSYTWTVFMDSPPTLTFDATCGKPPGPVMQYTATPTTLSLSVTDVPSVLTYTRQ